MGGEYLVSNPPLLTSCSPEAVKEREIAFVRIERELQRTDLNKLPDTFGELDRTRQYMEGLRFGKAMVAESLDHKKSAFESITPGYRLSNGSPFGLHVVMFIPSLKLLASPEQLAYWLPLAESYRIIGTYCQTELGHGSFVRGLETTATFDPQTDEFVLHSPTTSATKYWPGGLGYSASHAIVMARSPRMITAFTHSSCSYGRWTTTLRFRA